MAESSEHTDFQELAERLREGDASALRELANVLVPWLSGRIGARFGSLLNHEDVDDVVAQTLYRLWERRGHYRPERVAFPHWCYVIARNFALDLLRQKARERKHVPALWEELSRRSSEETAVPALSEEAVAAFRAAFRRLDPLERRVVLASVENPSGWATALAERLDMEAGTVRQKRFRALQKLRQELKRRGFAPV